MVWVRLQFLARRLWLFFEVDQLSGGGKGWSCRHCLWAINVLITLHIQLVAGDSTLLFEGLVIGHLMLFPFNG